MKKIKFRAWNYYDEKMCEVVDLDFKDKSALLYSKNNTDDPVDEVRFSFEDIELMQFTGLKDKNGRDIYESDVVNFIVGDTSVKYIIEYKDAGFVLKAKKKIYIIKENDVKYIEVVGNIFENPVLLEKIK